ncbi:hypothetical protein GCM10027093_53810 [Paraburkholderia jirisanensis]
MKKFLATLVLCIASTAAFAQSAPAQNATAQNATAQNATAQNATAGAPAPMAGGARMERAMEQLQSRFSSANTTHDGKLTKDQAATGMPRVAQHFDEIDTQKVGYVTLPQIEQFMMSQRKQ